MQWEELANRVLDGVALTRNDALAILQSDDGELLAILHAAFRVRYEYFGLKVKLNMIVNAKSGICPEDCGYCSQSIVSTAPVPKVLDARPDDPYSGWSRGVDQEGRHVLHRRQRPRSERA